MLQNHVRLCTLGFVSSRAFLVLHLNITLFTSLKIAPSLLSIDLSRRSPRRAIWRITAAEPFPQNSHVRFSTLLPVKTTLSCSSSKYHAFHKEKGFSSQYYTFHYLSIVPYINKCASENRGAFVFLPYHSIPNEFCIAKRMRDSIEFCDTLLCSQRLKPYIARGVSPTKLIEGALPKTLVATEVSISPKRAVVTIVSRDCKEVIIAFAVAVISCISTVTKG